MNQESVDDPVGIERRGAVAIITLNRPGVRNAVDESMRSALRSALDAVGGDSAVRAIVLTGAGTAFCAGGDISAMRRRLEQPPGQVAAEGWRHQRRHTHRLVVALHGIEKPVIAAVNGAAAGLGADIALACDAIVASRSARFVYSYVLRGLIPDGGGMYFLPRRIGLARAKELIFTGRTVDAEEALGLGLVDELVTPASLLDRAVARAADYGRASPTAIGLAKSIMNRSFEMSVDDVLSAGSAAQGICYSSAEHRSAVTAFLEKAK